MYLHLGNDIVIKKKNILGIYDIDNTTISKRTREFLEYYEKSGRLTYTTAELPKSFIVYAGKDSTHVYVSQISTSTLLKRCEFIKKISEI